VIAWASGGEAGGTCGGGGGGGGGGSDGGRIGRWGINFWGGARSTALIPDVTDLDYTGGVPASFDRIVRRLWRQLEGGRRRS
jgi:hypothetical protein